MSDHSDDEQRDVATTSQVNASTMLVVLSPEVRLNPHQPKQSAFPPHCFGDQTQSFQSCWFEKWKWLDWDDGMSCVFYHPCRKAALLYFKLFKAC